MSTCTCGGEVIATGCAAASCEDPQMCLECGAGCDLLAGGACAVLSQWRYEAESAQ